MKYLSILLILLASFAYANEVKVEIDPQKPVAGEVFRARFTITSDVGSGADTPLINFIPSGVEVIGKSGVSTSTRAIFSNGTYVAKKTWSSEYELSAPKVGYASLRDINIQIGNQTVRHPTVSFSVIKEPEQMAEVFVMADVPKKTIFLGEGILVRYYLYHSVRLNAFDIKKFPKLTPFLKRFLQEQDRPEYVSVNGNRYVRVQIYAARLFPEKVGQLKIDSLNVSATFLANVDPNDALSAFRSGGDVKTRSLSSEAVTIDVKPLPQPVPEHFTGLVGKHDFELKFGTSKLIVNEPLEVKLTVTGVGALENLEAPDLIKNPGLEEFESNGDLKIANANEATKTFDYTFLAKENLKLPAKDIQLSYLDPDTEKYVVTQLKIPEIVVGGGQTKKETSSPEKPKTKPSPKAINQIAQDFAAPLSISEEQWRKWLPFINILLAVIAIVFGIAWMLWQKKFKVVSLSRDIPSSFKKGPFPFSEFVKWMSPLILKTGKSPLLIIKESDLSEESKRYFVDLLTANDYKDYSTRKSEMDYKYQPSYFKELSKYIESIKNESSP